MPKKLRSRMFLAVVALSLVWAAPAFAAESPGAASGRPQGSGRPLFSLESADDRLVVVDWDRGRIRERAKQRRRFQVERFPLRAGVHIDLELEPFSIAGPSSRFVIGRIGHPDRDAGFDPAAISLFRGRVLDHPGSHVFLALSEDGSTGSVDLGPGKKRYRLSSKGKAGKPMRPGRTSVFEVGDASSPPPDVPLCGTDTSSFEPVAEAVSGTPDPIKGLKQLQLAVETDYEFFSLFGDSASALTYAYEMYAQVSDIYMRDVDTRVELSFVRIWDQPNDLFNNVDPSPLSEFREYWNDNMGGVTRDAAQLFSGRRDYPFGGQAHLNALCGTSGYSVVGYAMGFFSDPTIPSPYNYDISVTAHELGHNSGTGHTQDNGIDTCQNPLSTPQRGTIMAYCGQTWSGGNSNRDLYLHSIIQQNIDQHINNSSCIVDDCNQNSVADATDISQSTSQDVNFNGIPDECEDCNENMILDSVDIAGSSFDVDSNGVPDECQPDCNGNLVPDLKDIADSTSTDAYGNDIPDECETDCDGDLISDYTEIQLNMSLDLDRNTRLDACQDCDGDLVTDFDTLGSAHRAWVASGLTGSPIREFHPTTGVLMLTSAGGAGALADEGHDLIVAPGDRILVTSAGDNRVMEFDIDGNYVGNLVAPGSGGLSTPTGMVVTPDEATLLVGSADTHSVLAYDLSTGASQGVFVPTLSGGLLGPFGLAYGPNGNLFVTSDDAEVIEYDGGTGALVRVFVTAVDNGGLDLPRGIAFKPDGNLLVASFGTDQVLEYDGQTGESLGRWALSGTPTRLTQISPWGIRIGPNGNVFVVRTGESFGSGGGGAHDHGEESVAPLHLTNAQIYEFDARNGNFLRAYINGNDHGMEFPSGFDFAPGWDIDCNFNMLPDSCDIAQGFSLDGDLSGIPDECEVDCNSNGTWDRLDVIPYGTALDCNANLSPDSCDIAGGGSLDCTGNGIPDECEPDCNDNGVADSCDIAAGTDFDCNGNGILDTCDVTDDAEYDTGWATGLPGDTANAGIWTRVDPVGSLAQPADDHSTTGQLCFVTGQGTVGGGVGAADVDGGKTTLQTPPLDLTGFDDPEIGYWRWFSNSAGSGPDEDTFEVDISNDNGGNWTSVEIVGPSGPETDGGWFFHRFRVADFVAPTFQTVLRFVAKDTGTGSIVEAAIDDLIVFPDCCTASLDCDDGLSCTTDSCGLAGACSNDLAAGNCLISGTCYASGNANPSNNCEECDVAMPLAWTAVPPVEVEAVTVTQSGTTDLNWATQGPAVYDVAGGDLTDLLSGGGSDDALCLAEGAGAGSWSDARPDPVSGDGHYYLVRSEKSCGVGTYGAATSGSERLPLLDCP